MTTKLAGGIQRTVTPPVHIYYLSSYSAASYSADQVSTNSQTFVFNAGLGLQARLKKRIFFIGGLDIYDSVVNMPGVSEPQKNIIFLTATIGLAFAIR